MREQQISDMGGVLKSKVEKQLLLVGHRLLTNPKIRHSVYDGQLWVTFHQDHYTEVTR